jgi:hypothetical protein
MLVEKTLVAGEIVVLKLRTGDEIVGRIKSDIDGIILIQQPLRCAIARNEDGEQAKYLLPLLMLAPEADIPLRLIDIVTFVSAPSEVASAWSRETSGLIL